MKKTLQLASVLLLACLPFTSPAQDIKGSKDHALISRYPGSVIQYYEEQKFKPYKIAIGPETGYKKIDKVIEAEGKLTRIYYVVKGNTTLTEIYRNYLSALQKGGFTVLAKGIHDERNVSKEIGGRSWLGTVYIPNPLPSGSKTDLFHGSATSGGSCYIAASLEKNGGRAYIVMGGTQYKSDERVFLVDIIEETAMEDGLVKVNADAMLSGINREGKIALYGIYFDFDKAVVKPESNEAITEIAKLLQKNSSLKLYIVGHTDMQGQLSYNMDLSKKRAAAVVQELTAKHGISASRLESEGVGPLCPVSTNNTEEGRKLNRRVELVAR